MHRLLARLLALLIASVGLVAVAQAPSNAIVDRDCGDFPSQAAAQNFFLANGGPRSDPHRLDDDGDGIACESNPCPCIGRGQSPNPGPSTPPPPRVFRETGNVTRVIDGDTLKVRIRGGGTVSVRMLGINTPERGRCGASDATKNLKKLAPVGSTVNLVSDPSQAAKDRYNRLLRYVKRQGGYADLSFRQMWDGFSKPYVFNRKPVNRHREYVRASKVANRKDRGLWASCWAR